MGGDMESTPVIGPRPAATHQRPAGNEAIIHGNATRYFIKIIGRIN